MVYSCFLKTIKKYPNKLFICDSEQSFSYNDAWIEIQKYMKFYVEKDINKVYFYAHDSTKLILAFLAAVQLGIESCILNRQYPLNEINSIIKNIGQGTLITDQDLDNISSVKNINSNSVKLKNDNKIICNKKYSKNNGNIIILTTGTTGKAKAVLYSWQRLLSQGRLVSEEDARWLLIYPLNHFAGIQLLIHILINKNSLIIPKSRDIKDLISSININGVNAISATPTFWRFFIGKIKKEQLKQISLKYITLGGEASDINLLNRLKQLFPNTSISQVYATTELGSCFSVKDGLPGFPKGYLNKPVGNVELKIIDGELFVKTDKKMIKYLDKGASLAKYGDWVATGDLVEIVEDRLLFRGRKSEIINVGGVKVFPLKVEEIILKVDGVKFVRVYGNKNPITGQIVCAEIEIEKGYELNLIREKIKKICELKLNRYEVPRIISFVHEIKRANEKIIRRI